MAIGRHAVLMTSTDESGSTAMMSAGAGCGLLAASYAGSMDVCVSQRAAALE